jgi:DNA-binding transcriptional MerR regulator/methylmalonyl-CoA mutase cobalamin-binding subunit
MDTQLSTALSISAVERETGLSKDVLRKWETRYGFPTPLRDSLGERAYPIAQVDRLRLIKRLMDAGMRPSRLVAESDAGLNALAQGSQIKQARPDKTDVETLTLEKLRNQDPNGLRQLFNREVLRQGIQDFVLDTLEPLNHAVGDAWARGELGVHEEHLYTEAVQWLLRSAIAKLSDSRGTPRILLTTLPEEQHGLGLLMLSSILSLHGAYCISLGTQTPVQDIVNAAQTYQVDIVGLSFSNAYPQRRILPALLELRQRLPANCDIWGGGSGCARLTAAQEGALLLPDMEQVLETLNHWRAKHQAR